MNKLTLAGNAYLINKTFQSHLKVDEESNRNRPISKQIELTQIKLSKGQYRKTWNKASTSDSVRLTELKTTRSLVMYSALFNGI